MHNNINPLQKYSPKDWSGLTTKNHIGAMWGEQPIMVSNLVDNIYDVNLGLDLDRFMDQFPSMEIERDAPFEWMLNNASPFKNIPLVQYYTNVALDASSNTATPGIGLSRFYLEFPDRIFEAMDVIGYGYTEKETYQFRITEDPKPNGSNWVYTVELVTGDYSLFAKAEDLVAGQRFVKMYAPAEQTLSERGSSSITFSSPFRMQNRCTFIRGEYMVPGNMIDQKENEPLGFFFIDALGKRHSTWINKLDYDFLVQFKRQKAMLQLYGKANKTSQGTYGMKGESGYEIRMGSGLYEQIAPSNVHYYSTFNIDVLSDILMSLSVGKLPEDSRRFVLGTGEYGMRQFHQAVETKAVTFAPSREEIRINGTLNNMGYGGQFKRYSFLNGIEIELMHIPFLDDPSLNPIKHPNGGCLSSYEYLILDFGTSQGKPNIQKVNVKGANDIFRYIPGLRDPFSPGGLGGNSAPSMTVSSVDGYKVMRAHTCGLKVHNPMRIARFIPVLS
jgi:hypothetical protein